MKGCFENKIFLICGGAGTGKTTIMKKFYEILKQNGFSSIFCAPTGRAAQRIKEAVGCEAKTIHRILGFKRMFMSSINKIKYESIVKTDYLIIDEFSIIDIYTMYSILSSISENTNLIFLGDYNQLPSIQPGNILYDLFFKIKIKNIFLTKIFRQENENKIIFISNKIIQNESLKLVDFENECIFLKKIQKKKV